MKEVFKVINDKTISNTSVGVLLSRYDFTEKHNFDKLYYASINFIKHWKNNMICEIQDVKRTLNQSVYESYLVPIKLPERDVPLKLLEYYFNTAVRTYIKFLRTKHQSPRDCKYIVKANNNQHVGRKKKFTVSTVIKEWSKYTLKLILQRIEISIISHRLTKLNDLSITMKSYKIISGGAYNGNSVEDIIYTKRSIIQIKNKGNSCFWWCIILLMYQNIELHKEIKDLRYTNRLDNVAKKLCLDCGCDYTAELNSDDIHEIIELIPTMVEPMFE